MQRRVRPFMPERVLAGGFLLAIAAGSAVLALPVCAADGKSIGAMNALFMATSAVCVTGLAVVDTAGAFSAAGQVMLLGLIQLGGLGFMIIATMMMSVLGRRITLHNRMLLREGMSAASFTGLGHLAKSYGLMAFGLEAAGAALLAVRFVPAYGWGKGVYYSIFHAVSAFCNAGFDLMGQYRSLTAWRKDPLVLGVLAVLIQLGGLGFSVLLEVGHHGGRWRKLSLHAKVVLAASLLATAGGAVLYALLEWNNPATLARNGEGMGSRLLGAYFQAVTMRTAGFATVNLADMTDAGKLVSILLMMVGASPASTGGGLKTTTVSVLVLIMHSVLKGQEDVNAFGRRLPTEVMRRAIAILVVTLGVWLAGVVALAVMEPGAPLADVMLECTSAIATVGVSSMGTPGLSLGSKAVLMALMYLGRVGPMTLGTALYRRRGRSQVKYPEEKMMIG